MRTCAIKDDYALAKASSFDLNARKHKVFLNEQIVPVIFTERNCYEIPGLHEIVHDAQFGNITDALRIAFRNAHTRFHTTIVGNACATSRSLCAVLMERAAGIEPALSAWKAEALPLCNARKKKNWWAGLDSNQRTALAGQIYSLLPLTTRPPTHGGVGPPSILYFRRGTADQGTMRPAPSPVPFVQSF